MKWRPKLVKSGQKIILMKMEHMKIIDSISFLQFPLCKLSGAFGLTAAKGGKLTILIQRTTWTMWVLYPTRRIKASTK